MRIWISNKLPGIVHAAGPKTAVEENFTIFVVVIVQLLSHAQFFATPWTAAHQASLSITVYRSLLRCMSSESMILTISSSATLFILCLQFVPASRSFPMSYPFASGGQNIRASASASVLPKSWLVKLCSN